MHQVTYEDLGLIDYKTCWDIQEAKMAEVIERKQMGLITLHHLYFVEHPHVYTLGKSGQENNLLINPDFLEKIQARFYRINRGGDITYHGPGQLVGYPIFDLEAMQLSARIYIYNLEESVIQYLAGCGVTAGRLDNAIGVWLDAGIPGKARKICSIGVRISRSVTMHGFAFNINTDLGYFSHINPCGFVDKGVTSLAKETGRQWDLEEVKKGLLQKMCAVFGFDCK